MMSRESEKYVEILTAFLKMHTVDTMVLEGIDVWHSQLTEVNSKEVNVIANSADDDNAINDMEDADESGGALSEEEEEEEEEEKEEEEEEEEEEGMGVGVEEEEDYDNFFWGG